MPSRANASLLPTRFPRSRANSTAVSMPSRANASLLHVSIPVNLGPSEIVCQCPHGLMPHCYREKVFILSLLIRVSMPSRANASLLPRRP